MQYLAGFGFSLDVEDVYYESNAIGGNVYVLCGIYTIGIKGESFGFLLRVDTEGFPIKARMYQEILVFTSIVPWQIGKGYVAVGQFTKWKKQVKDDAFVSIKKRIWE